jgi:GMP synthase (glutamine-hydrolysing)
MQILIIDNNVRPDCWGSPDLVRCAREAMPGATIMVRRGPENDLPADPKRFNRIIVSGSLTSCQDLSPWTLAEEDFLRRALDAGIPVLGVCYGHQILARALGGKDVVGKAAKGEHGWTKIKLSGHCAITQGLPNEFWSFSAHYEEVKTLPKGAVAFGSTPACAYQVVAYEGKPAFSIQFHPEKNEEEAEETFQDMRKNGKGAQLLHPKETHKLYDPSVARRIFSNFLSPELHA